MSFIFTKTSIPDIISITPKIFDDDRGYFFENFHNSIFTQNNIEQNIVQENFSFSKKHVLRGLHFQKPPKSQAKLVSVTSGEIFDVAVDLRKNSPTFGKWVSEILSSKNHKSLFIPEGFAHGFCVLSETASVLYKINREYSPEHEGGIVWNDPELNISWPIERPLLSKKDQNLPFLNDQENIFDF